MTFNADTWYAISLVGYFVAFIFLVVSVILYFKLDIPDVFGDLSGRTVAKEIKSMREKKTTKGQPAFSQKRSAGKGSSKSAKNVRSSNRMTRGRTVSQGGASVKPQNFKTKKATNGTAQISAVFPKDAAQQNQEEKLVLHGKTGKLNRETEELYENFDPRIEFTKTSGNGGNTAILPPDAENDPQEAASAKAQTQILPTCIKSGTTILEESSPKNSAKETALLSQGTCLPTEDSAGGTTLLVEPVKFSITRSYLVVHTEESIL